MQVTLFGASGKVGRHVADELLKRGYQITVFIHSSPVFDDNPSIKVVKGDVHDIDSVRKAIRGSDVIISTLGSWGTPTKDILSSATANIIKASEKKEMRFISVTGSDARVAGDTINFTHRISHALLYIFAGKVIKDGEKHIELLETSNFKWTAIRSPVMLKSGKTKYKLSDKRPMPWSTISRQTVVKAIVDQIESDERSRRSPFIWRDK